MFPKVPVPTDNVYKFQATLGIALLITSAFLLVLNIHYSDQRVHSNLGKYISTSESSGSELTQRDIYQLEINKAKITRRYYSAAIGILIAIGLLLTYKGFRTWENEVQPVHDAILRLEKEKLELEVAALRNQAGSESPNTGENSTAS